MLSFPQSLPGSASWQRLRDVCPALQSSLLPAHTETSPIAAEISQADSAHEQLARLNRSLSRSQQACIQKFGVLACKCQGLPSLA